MAHERRTDAQSRTGGRARFRGGRAVVLAVATAALLSQVPVSAGPAQAVVVGTACPDVMVVAVRGSGDRPQADWTQSAPYSDPALLYGAGAINYDVYQRLFSARPDLHFSLDAVQYPAEPVTTLLNVVNGIKPYHASEQSGVTAILTDIGAMERQCAGAVNYVFTGHSQGAWVVHEALYKLAATLPSVMARVAGVTLFGDPELIPGQTIVRENRSVLVAPGVARLAAPGFFPDGYSNVPASVRSRTASYCKVLDFVCQVTPQNLSSLAVCPPNPSPTDPYNPSNLCAHTRYIVDGQTGRAAQFVEPNLPRRSVWPRVTSGTPRPGVVGRAYRWSATASPPAQTTYHWVALGNLPPGLSFSDSGVLNGTPTRAGTYTFTIRATQSPQQRSAAATVTVVITGGVVATSTVHAWGDNTYDQLGVGLGAAALPNSTSPRVVNLPGVQQVAGSRYNGFALTADGHVWSWGSNQFGGLGNGSTVASSSTPVVVSSLTNITSIASGMGSGYALRSDGTVWAWGMGDLGDLGNGTTSNSNVPVQVSTLTGVIQIGGGAGTGYALKGDGTVWAWGNGFGGVLGTTLGSLVPVQVGGLSGITAIAAGQNDAYALRGDGTVWAWGAGQAGAMGIGQNYVSAYPVPVQVSVISNVVAIAAGSSTGYALKSDGTVWSWGQNGLGELGQGTSGSYNGTPTQVVGLTNVTAVAAGSYSGYALRSDGSVWAWGYNNAGQLGDGTTVDKSAPVRVPGLASATALSLGQASSEMVLTTP